MIKSIFDTAEKVILYILAIMFAVMVFAIFMQIIQRFVFHDPNVWSEELTRFTFAWLSMLGSGIAVRRGRHMNVDYFINKMPKPVLKVVNIFTNILVLAFLIIMIVYGSNLVTITAKQASAGLSIPMAIPYAAIPVGGFLMLLFTIESYFVKDKDKVKVMEVV